MGASEKPTDATAQPDADLAAAWAAFRAGGIAPCRRDGAPMALCVDGSVAAYRFVCVQCGFASPWFESTPQSGMRVRGIGAPQEPVPPATDD
jgi:hypothetical protein